ncbi:hypothetical protein [Bradyrhizobium sp. McL0616]|uniref:hypothetical protein n=1 Tax=Bradyrhizobium sp. McL0616 TaxID=3415674 RepID=UPI003CEF483A
MGAVVWHCGSATTVVATTVRRCPRLPQAKAAKNGSSATRQRCGQISNVGKGNAGNTPASRNEGVGEHVRTRFHFDREATREIAEPENRSRTERRKLVSSAGPGFGERTRERERSDR